MTDIANLSFVRSRSRSEREPNGLLPRCFWSVQPTGDIEADNDIGTALALEYLEFEASGHHGPGILQYIVKDMPRELTGIEVSFLQLVGFAAAEGLPQAQQIARHWRRSAEQAA